MNNWSINLYIFSLFDLLLTYNMFEKDFAMADSFMDFLRGWCCCSLIEAWLTLARLRVVGLCSLLLSSAETVVVNSICAAHKLTNNKQKPFVLNLIHIYLLDSTLQWRQTTQYNVIILFEIKFVSLFSSLRFVFLSIRVVLIFCFCLFLSIF